VHFLGGDDFNIAEGPTSKAFDEIFHGKDWRHPTKAGTLYRGEFLENGFGKYWGGEGYGNSDKYMAQLHAAVADADGLNRP
jgi:hypothetical protein